MCYCHCHDYLAGRFTSTKWKILCCPLNLILCIPGVLYRLICCPAICFILTYRTPEEDPMGVESTMEFYPTATSNRIDCFLVPHLWKPEDYQIVTGRVPTLLETQNQTDNEV